MCGGRECAQFFSFFFAFLLSSSRFCFGFERVCASERAGDASSRVACKRCFLSDADAHRKVIIPHATAHRNAVNATRARPCLRRGNAVSTGFTFIPRALNTRIFLDCEYLITLFNPRPTRDDGGARRRFARCNCALTRARAMIVTPREKISEKKQVSVRSMIR